MLPLRLFIFNSAWEIGPSLMSGIYCWEIHSHSPLIKLPTPRTKVKSETTRGGEIRSSSASITQPSLHTQASSNLLQMRPIICVQIAEKLGPSKPKINANKINTPSVLPNPQRKAQERPLPTHEMTMTVRTGM